jgi:hypothetical protein
MDKFNCKPCGFSTNDKTNYSRHLKTKKHLRFGCNPNATQMQPNATQMQPNATQMQPNATQMQPNATQMQPNTTKPKHICKYCNKEFTLRQGVERHIKNSCKKNNDESFKEMARLMNEVASMKKDMLKKGKEQNEIFLKKCEEQKKIILKKDKELQTTISKQNKKYENLQKQLGKLNNKLQITNNTLNNNSNNNHTIVVLNSFYKPDMSQLTNECILKHLKNIGMCLPNLVQDVYFNPKNPSNHSICVSNLKKEFATVFNGEHWDTITVEYLLNKLSFWGEDFFEDWLYDFGSDKLIEKFERRINNVECSTELQKDTKNNLLLMCYNGQKHLQLQNCIASS